MTRLDTVISREHPVLSCAKAWLSVGRDGRVYLTGWLETPLGRSDDVLGMTVDGGLRRGVASPIGRNTVLGYVTANSAGYLARAETHAEPGVTVIDRRDEEVLQWRRSRTEGHLDASARVEAGESGRIYVLAQYGVVSPGSTAPHVVDLGDPASPAEPVLHPLPFTPDKASVLDFRISDAGGEPVFFVLYKASSDGVTRLAKVRAGGQVVWDRSDGHLRTLVPHESGGFDLGADGRVYLVTRLGDRLLRYPDNGTGAPDELPFGADRPLPTDTAPYRELRIWQQQVVLQRRQDRELYSVFALPAPGSAQVAFQRSVWSRHDFLSAEIPEDRPWEAGTSVPVTVSIGRSDGGEPHRLPAPTWRAWGRSPGAQDHREFTVTPDQADPTRLLIGVPGDVSGLVQFSLSPDTAPYRVGRTPAFRVRRVVEVRPRGATGSVSLGTRGRSLYRYGNGTIRDWVLNRTRYAAGEPIELSVSVRQDPPAVKQLVLRLDDVSGSAPRTVATSQVTVPAGAPLTVTVPAAVTGLLKPGRYLLTADTPGFAVAAQPIELGPGRVSGGHRRVWFADLTAQLYPGELGASNALIKSEHLDIADVVATHLDRVRRLGWTIVVDRLGILHRGGIAVLEWDQVVGLDVLVRRLTVDRKAIDPAKVITLSPLLDTVTGLGALGVEQRGVLLINDTYLPMREMILLPEYYKIFTTEARSPVTRYHDLLEMSSVLMRYHGFGGWQWGANWWTWQQSPDVVAKMPETGGAAFAAALKTCRDKGTWSPLLGMMAADGTNHATDAQRRLREILRVGVGAEADRLVTSAAGPFYQINVYPPDSYREVDEVDLQAQWEQFPLFLHTAFAIDYHTRPGKPSTLHPQNNNDSGTGDQTFGQAFAALLRGSDTSGHAELVPTFREPHVDPRDDVSASFSVLRVLSEVLHEYGGWVRRFDGDDPVAILLSRRQFAVQSWTKNLPEHLARVFEAYLSCLYAQVPASVVFVEDLDLPGTRPITDYAAVLLVHERTEFGADMVAALGRLTAAGTPVFHDGTSRDTPPELDVVRKLGSKPLGVAFDKETALNRHGGSDGSYRIWRRFALEHRPALRSALGGAAGRVGCADPDVLLSERKFGAARVVLALNNSLFDVDPAVLRRAAPVTAITPPAAEIALTLPPAHRGLHGYDVLAARPVSTQNGTMTADFRHWPIAILALLPEPIDGVKVDAVVVGNNRLRWSAEVVTVGGATIDTPVPVRVRILDEGNAVLWEQHTESPARGEFEAPAQVRGQVRVETVELLAGHQATDTAGVTTVPLPLDLLTGPRPGGSAPPGPAETSGDSAAAAEWRPAASRLGARVRGLALSGNLAVFATANWDANLYALDLGTGQQRWQARIGQHFTFDPEAVSGAIAVRGTALDAPSGHGLYLVDPATGVPQRRFDLHGTQPRWGHRITPRINDGRPPAFAVPPSGSWVATAGNQGIAVWKRDGTPLWHVDWWQQATPRERPGTAADAFLVAVNEDTLLVIARDQVTSYRVSTGGQHWSRTLLGPVTTIEGRATAAAVGPDGRVCALATTHDGGMLVLLDVTTGNVVSVLPGPVHELAWAPDGRTLVTLHDSRIELCRVRPDGWALDRSFPGGDVLHNLAVAADGRIACGDEQGRVVVLDANANPLWSTDVEALPAPQWLPGGDLLVATRLGQVSRRTGASFQPVWSAVLKSSAADVRGRLLAPEERPVSRITGSGNGQPPADPPPANVLTRSLVRTLTFKVETHQDPVRVDIDAVLAPRPVPPVEPWLTDFSVDFAAQGFPAAYLLLETTTAVTFDSLTLHDDPAHPESWLRDLRLEVRHGPAGVWRQVARLVSDLPSRTYRGLHHPDDPAKPVTAAQLRLVAPPGVWGNIRLAGLALHLLG
ncbi:PQQ-binding-like beta-propeller repeat protein [Amycolatopsis anabasis]|uniref:outer membrane protein assembly factor BamB family protein n=1 Tax=Amycolatopsis anabasis TaxID=1840409 RepID=UPI00131D776E|nr:PQQ-binding-like beta-propeller repeat protein [Amycolatopsis anabasis]